MWLLAIVITLGSVVYQRVTGPTHPVRGSVDIDGEEIKFRFLRTHETTGDAEMRIAASNDVRGEIKWRRFKSHDEWTVDTLNRDGADLVISIPGQPSAGKIIYEVALTDTSGARHPLTEEPVIIRFKDPVPGYILWPHIVLMFAGMLLATRTGLDAVARGRNTYRFALVTSVLIFLGGLVFGPIVQKFAFGAFWTGWPVGHDLTDTKTAFAMLFWLVALWRGRDQRKGRFWLIVAALVTLLVYLVPHSVLGSELDYTKME
jgi:hypothetical protein